MFASGSFRDICCAVTWSPPEEVKRCQPSLYQRTVGTGTFFCPLKTSLFWFFAPLHITLVYLGWTLSTCCPTNTYTQTHTSPWRPRTVAHLRMRKHANSLLHVLDSPVIKSADLHLYKTQYVDNKRFHPRVGQCCSKGLHCAEPAAHIFRQRTPVRSNVQVKLFKLQDLSHDLQKHGISETSLHEEGSTGCCAEL